MLPALAALAALLASPERPVNSCREIDIAFDTDVEFVLRRCYGDPFEVRRYVADLVTQASAITAASLDVRLRLAEIRVRTGSSRSDPWNAPIDEDQLEQLREVWTRDESGTRRDLTVLVSGRDLGGSPAFPGSIGSDSSYAVLSGLYGPNSGRLNASSEWTRRHDLVAFLRSVATVCGATRTQECNDECDPAENPTQSLRGSLMSRCDECPGGIANIDLRFDDANIATMWERMAQSPHPLGSAEQGARAMPDVLFAVPGTSASIDPLTNDAMVNCGPVSLPSADAATARGWPILRMPIRDAEGGEIGSRLVISVPANAVGTDTARYTLIDSEGATAIGSIEILTRSADFNADGFVDDADLSELMAKLGESGRAAALTDLNGDGVVSDVDLGILLAAWRPKAG